MHTISSVLSTIERGDYTFKIDLPDAYFHVLIHPDSRKYLRFTFENKIYQFRVLPFGLNTVPPGIHPPGTYSGSLPPLSRDISNSISRRLVDTSSRPPSFTSPPVSVTKRTEYGRPRVKRSQIRTRTSSGYPVSGASITLGSGESFTPNIQSSGDNGTILPNILPEKLVIQGGIPTHGITQLGLRSHPTESSTLEPDTTTLSFFRSDKPVFSTTAFRPPSPCHPRQWQDLSFLTSGIPIRPFQAEFTIFTDASNQGWVAHMGDSKIADVWTYAERGHINVLDLKAVFFALHHWAAILQGHLVLIATDNTTVVAYINKQGGTHSHRLLRLVEDLFLWLQIDSGHNSESQTHYGLPQWDSIPPVSAEPAHHDRAESPH